MTQASPTIEAQAKELGCSRSTLLRHRRRGLPKPRPGERLSAWRRRAERWQQRHVGAPGRRSTVDAEQALLGWRRARAQRAELRLARVAEQVHDSAACNEAQASRLATITGVFADVPALLAAAVPAVRDRYHLHSVAERTVRAAHASLYERVTVAEPIAAATARDPAPDPDATLSVKIQSEYWLAVWRTCRTETERRELARERGDVHDFVLCEQTECARIQSYVQALGSLPDLWGATLLHLSADAVRAKATADLVRIANLLRGEFDVADDEIVEPAELEPEQPAPELVPSQLLDSNNN
jgi:hypothetical protein